MQYEDLINHPLAVAYLKEKVKEELTLSLADDIPAGMDFSIPEDQLEVMFESVVKYNPSAIFNLLDDKGVKIGIMPQDDELWAYWNTYDNISNMAKTREEANINALLNAIKCLDQILTKESDTTKES